MNISRRSFLKLAALSTVAAAGAVTLTSCATPFTPNLTIILQEVKNGDALYTASDDLIDGKKAEDKWKDGEHSVSSAEYGLFDLATTVGELVDNDGKKALELVNDELKKTYKLTGKTAELAGSLNDSVKASDLAHYTITIKFKVVDKK